MNGEYKHKTTVNKALNPLAFLSGHSELASCWGISRKKQALFPFFTYSFTILLPVCFELTRGL